MFKHLFPEALDPNFNGQTKVTDLRNYISQKTIELPSRIKGSKRWESLITNRQYIIYNFSRYVDNHAGKTVLVMISLLIAIIAIARHYFYKKLPNDTDKKTKDQAVSPPHKKDTQVKLPKKQISTPKAVSSPTKTTQKSGSNPWLIILIALSILGIAGSLWFFAKKKA